MALMPESSEEDGPWPRDSLGSSRNSESPRLTNSLKDRVEIARVEGHQDVQVSTSPPSALLLVHPPTWPKPPLSPFRLCLKSPACPPLWWKPLRWVKRVGSSDGPRRSYCYLLMVKKRQRPSSRTKMKSQVREVASSMGSLWPGYCGQGEIENSVVSLAFSSVRHTVGAQ